MFEDRLTLLLCCNASGEFMAKPLLVYRSLNPRALKNVNKNTLPVYWKVNLRAWITENLFKDCFSNCFVSSVELYLRQKNFSFKTLLPLDNAPCHSQNSTDPNVRIVFLLPDIASLLQPLNQGIIYTFKTYYIRRLEANDFEKKFQSNTVSLKEIKTSIINACWRRYSTLCVKHQKMKWVPY